MIFIDGTNLLRGIGRELQIPNIRADKPTDSLLKLASSYVWGTVPVFGSSSEFFHVRTYWFASYRGNDEEKRRISETLRSMYFEPVLFQKLKGREKGVDIALTMSMLTNAFNQNFDFGILFAGDKDYTELVKETKRYGQVIAGSYFEEGLSDSLKLSFDYFHTPQADNTAKNYIKELSKDNKRGEIIQKK